MSKTHALKTWPYYFDASWRGLKPWEVRRNDRGFAAGDFLVLEEYDDHKKEYLGRQIGATIVEVFENLPGVADGYVLLTVKALVRVRQGSIVPEHEAVKEGPRG